VVIHRAIYGSLERFIAVLLEHFAGHLPLWLAPIQAEVILVQDDVPEVVDYATALVARFADQGLRAEINTRPGERMQARVRDAELRKVPYVVVVGKRDVERGDDVVRVRDTRRDEQHDLAVAELLERLRAEALERRPR
jgi:threonyl-tRNA synthetase